MFIRTFRAFTLISLLLPITFSAHSQIFINYDGLSIKGDSQADGFQDWIQVDSYQLGAGRAIGDVLSGNRDVSRVNLTEVTLTKQFDNSSVPLRQEIFNSQARKLVEIHFTKSVDTKLESYFIVRLNNVLLSSISASSGGDRPSESLSLNYARIEWEYRCVDSRDTGCKPSKGGYDLQTAKPF